MSAPAGHLVFGPWQPSENRDEAKRHADAIRERYPKDPDSSVSQILGYLDLMGTSHRLIGCFDGNALVGLISYQEYPTGYDPPFIFPFNFAVLPGHQRQGIGTALLEQLKDTARGRFPIVVRGINEVAIPRLRAAGFWEVEGFRNRRFKWSDLPEHQDDATPWEVDND